MTIDIQTIKTKALSMLHVRGGSRGPSGIVDPVRDWKLVLLGFSLLVLFSGVWAFFSYTGQTGSAPGSEETAARKPRLDRDALTQTLEALEARRSAHETARAQAPTFIDPGR